MFHFIKSMPQWAFVLAYFAIIPVASFASDSDGDGGNDYVCGDVDHVSLKITGSEPFECDCSGETAVDIEGEIVLFDTLKIKRKSKEQAELAGLCYGSKVIYPEHNVLVYEGHRTVVYVGEKAIQVLIGTCDTSSCTSILFGLVSWGGGKCAYSTHNGGTVKDYAVVGERCVPPDDDKDPYGDPRLAA